MPSAATALVMRAAPADSCSEHSATDASTASAWRLRGRDGDHCASCLWPGWPSHSQQSQQSGTSPSHIRFFNGWVSTSLGLGGLLRAPVEKRQRRLQGPSPSQSHRVRNQVGYVCARNCGQRGTTLREGRHPLVGTRVPPPCESRHARFEGQGVLSASGPNMVGPGLCVLQRVPGGPKEGGEKEEQGGRRRERVMDRHAAELEIAAQPHPFGVV
eukprot:351020-Chlamydomonas_euryale.AAC.3